MQRGRAPQPDFDLIQTMDGTCLQHMNLQSSPGLAG
jgi:hypothetical protein